MIGVLYTYGVRSRCSIQQAGKFEDLKERSEQQWGFTLFVSASSCARTSQLILTV